MKDHKPNFKNKPTCRLINPCKSEIGKISKKILDRINSKIRKSVKLNQWRSTQDVISWFNSIDDKQQYSFISFDVCEFYPSISEKLLNSALDFASSFECISDQEREIILHTKKSFLYNNTEPWCKRGDTQFDVTMGSFDSAESCELVGLYILSQLEKLDINIGLYRDDGLAVCKKSPHQVEKIKKEICRIFSTNNLKITIDANKKTVDFLDVTFDLRSGTYRPFTKPNNVPLYVHRQSDHPPSIIKNIPDAINKRLSTNSSNEKLFNEAATTYQEALNKCGYNYKLRYEPIVRPERKPKRRRTRRISWFNPPFSNIADTNIGKQFFRLIDECFPPEHKLHKILNRNTVKLSYGCMPNIGSLISAHNKAITAKSDNSVKNCNCREPKSCPLENKCLANSVIYQATVSRHDNNKTESYVGLTENTFKTRFIGHTSSFKNIEKRNATALSEYVWKLKDTNVPYSINWKILSKAKAYSPASKKCYLCLKEKYFIICKQQLATLNKRNELNSKCRHRNKYLLCNQK